MDDQNLKLFKQELIKKYSGTFNPETEKVLRELKQAENTKNDEKEYVKYHMVAANCAIYLFQKTQEVSTNTLEFFRQCTYHRYINYADSVEFSVEFGDVLKRVKTSILDLLDSTIPETYIQLGFMGISIDKNAVHKLEISDFFNRAQCSHLEIPVLLTRAGLDYLYWTVAKIEEGSIESDDASREMVMKLSTILIATHGLYSMLFDYNSFKQD